MEEASTLLSKEEEEAMWKELLAKKKSGRQKRVKRVRSLGAKEKRRQEETRQKALKAHITKMHSFGVRAARTEYVLEHHEPQSMNDSERKDVCDDVRHLVEDVNAYPRSDSKIKQRVEALRLKALSFRACMFAAAVEHPPSSSN